MYVNNFQCCGNLADEPILFSHNGSPGVSFVLALNKPGVPKPTYIKCVAWGHLASLIADYYHKGQSIYVSGELEMKAYVDREGITRKDISVKVEKFSGGLERPREAYIRKPRPPTFPNLKRE